MNRVISWTEITPVVENNDEEERDEEDSIAVLFQMDKTFSTPFGTCGEGQEFSPTHGQHWYRANTNFKLSEAEVLSISKIDGIESMRIFSNYTFVVVIAVLFDEEEVLSNIEEMLGANEHSHDDSFIEDAIEFIYGQVKEGDSWGAYIYPDGSVVYEKVKNPVKLKTLLSKYEKLKELSNGYTVSSDESDPIIETSNGGAGHKEELFSL